MISIGKTCPKCEIGSIVDGPHYVSSSYGESLIWRCSVCKYGESEPTKDYKKPEPNPNVGGFNPISSFKIIGSS